MQQIQNLVSLEKSIYEDEQWGVYKQRIVRAAVNLDHLWAKEIAIAQTDLREERATLERKEEVSTRCLLL